MLGVGKCGFQVMGGSKIVLRQGTTALVAYPWVCGGWGGEQNLGAAGPHGFGPSRQKIAWILHVIMFLHLQFGMPLGYIFYLYHTFPCRLKYSENPNELKLVILDCKHAHPCARVALSVSRTTGHVL